MLVLLLFVAGLNKPSSKTIPCSVLENGFNPVLSKVNFRFNVSGRGTTSTRAGILTLSRPTPIFKTKMQKSKMSCNKPR